MNALVGALALPSLKKLWEAQGYDSLSGNVLFSAPLIVVGIFVGIAIALLSNVFTKRVLGELVRKLLAEEASSLETAKTLDELGFGSKILLQHAVKGNVSLRRVVYCREEEEFLQKQEEACNASETPKKFRTKNFRVDPKIHHFYIPEAQKDAATFKFAKQGTSIGALWILLLLLFVLLMIVLFALPNLMGLLNNLIGSFGTDTTDMVLS